MKIEIELKGKKMEENVEWLKEEIIELLVNRADYNVIGIPPSKFDFKIKVKKWVCNIQKHQYMELI